jgi:hypothetical protein
MHSDIVNVCYRIEFCASPPLEVGDAYWQRRDALVHMEQQVLRVLRFRLVHAQPHDFILHVLRHASAVAVTPSHVALVPPPLSLGGGGVVESDAAHALAADGFARLAQLAVDIVNDSFMTTLCLHFDAVVVACAALHLACELEGARAPPVRSEWWRAVGVCDNDVESATHQLLNLYTDTQTQTQTQRGSASIAVASD